MTKLQDNIKTEFDNSSYMLSEEMKKQQKSKKTIYERLVNRGGGDCDGLDGDTD